MNKYCYICGREIKDHTLFYCIGPNSYVCDNKECYNTYFWDRLAAKFVTDRENKYVVIDGFLYQIDKDSNGRHHTIQFENGNIIDTDALWSIGEIPETKRDIFKDIARFVQKV